MTVGNARLWIVLSLLTGLSTTATASATNEHRVCGDVYRHVVSLTVRDEYPGETPAFHARETERRLGSLHVQARIEECAKHRLTTVHEVNRRATACVLKAKTFAEVKDCDERFSVVRR